MFENENLCKMCDRTEETASIEYETRGLHVLILFKL